MIHVTVITPQPLPAELFTGAATAAMQQVTDLLSKEFAKTVATWRNKPAFDKTVTEDAGRIVGEVSTDSDIYRYVSGGTRVRYATMSPDFSAKTQPHVIGSGPGSGGVLYISKMHPRPGIEAREFDKTIAEQKAKKIESILAAAVRAAIKASGHAIK